MLLGHSKSPECMLSQWFHELMFASNVCWAHVIHQMEIVMAFAVFVASCASLDAFMRVICRATYQLHHLHSINWPQEILIKFFCFAKRQNMQWDAIHPSLSLCATSNVTLHTYRSSTPSSSSRQSLYLLSDAVLIETVSALSLFF